MFVLTRHTYAAEVAGALIFLNLKADSYTYVAPEQAAEILPRHTGKRTGPVAPPSGEAGSIVDELKLAGLITAEGPGRPFRPIDYDNVVDELPRLIGEDRPRVGPGHVWNFVRSVLLARIMLTFLPLHWVVALVKKRGPESAGSGASPSAAQLTETYRRLRPLLFSRTDRCLLDSLSLIHFLRRYDVRASWRFGIRLEPFKAHAWAQQGGTVLDDMAANVHNFTVILEA
jgi:hypothetical protein